MIKDNIENDDEELIRQIESSWAHKQGMPTKGGIVLKHGVTIEKNEQVATNLMKEAMAKVNTKLKTKGRFQVGIPTNGLLNRNDMLWAQKANPSAHAAHVYREQLDIKMLQKKKKSRELSSMLWL